MEKQTPVVLLQSGGRDSAVACSQLLSKGIPVHAITFLRGNIETASVPRTRAEEIYRQYDGYSWAAIDYREWESGMTEVVGQRVSTTLPRSCLVCAMAKLTAGLKVCNALHTKSIAVGYVDYQNAWAEQTRLAIRLQEFHLRELGYELLLPARTLRSKQQAKSVLRTSGLSAAPLENPCCVSVNGTEPVGEDVISKVITVAFDYAQVNQPVLRVVESLGEVQLCL